MITKILTLATVLILLQSCISNKSTQKTSHNIPTNFEGFSKDDSVSIAALPIDQFIKDSTLQKILNNAIDKNFDYKIALQNILINEEKLRLTKAANHPNVNFDIAAKRTWQSSNSLNGTLSDQLITSSYLDDYNLGLYFNWEILTWGRIKKMKEASLADYIKSIEATRVIKTRLVTDISQAYYKLIMLDAQHKIVLKNIILMEHSLKLTKLQFNSGLVTNLAVDQMQVQLDEAKRIIPEIEENIITQENIIRSISGEFPKGVIRSNILENSDMDDTFLVGIPAQLLKFRPDIREAESNVNSSLAKMGVSKRLMYPSIKLTAGIGLNSFQNFNWLNVPNSLFETIGGGITQPILQNRKLKTQYNISKIELTKAKIEFDRVIVLAVKEVSDALNKIKKNRESLVIEEAKLKNLNNAILRAELLYQNGQASYLEVISAQSKMLESELSIVAIKSTISQANIELYRSLGGGWK
ncbi:hypothetical protein BBI01_17935 [Chryseobacterium artocarpi]|uniref:RND transporter n=1 Tax=Chryseobacterium artocarpi TaxID=1414727 RepID=A0A1B8ZBV0_9FLAO|nr:TolC family protein [Chryseobacterium artocarpi]OCA69091.1 hypothetical protein BBI01_17935 [Chryseobacterium artocarpi]